MTIFDYLKDILVTKKGNLTLDGYVPFLVNRWLSFSNPTVCEAVGLNLNTKTLLENKELHYKTVIAFFPKLKSCPRINYVKKVKEKEQDADTRINILAQNLEISIREATFLLNCLD